MMAAFKQALEDFSKGPEASKVLEGASPLGALLEFGKQALAKAGAQPPSPVVGRGDRRAARLRAAPAGAPTQAATAPAAPAPTPAPPGPGQALVPPKRGRPRNDTINPTEPKVPKGDKDKPAAAALLVQKLSSQVATLKADKDRLEAEKILLEWRAMEAERKFEKLQATAESDKKVAVANSKLGAAYLMLSGAMPMPSSASSSSATTPATPDCNVNLPNPSALEMFFRN